MIENKELEMILNDIDLNQPAPTQEPDRQYYFIKKARTYVEEEEKRLGRKLFCVVETFGCQMNAATQTAKAA